MSQRPAAPPPPTPSPPQSDGKSPKTIVHKPVPIRMSSGPVQGADAIVITGVEKIGKSTLAGCLPAPFFLDVDKGTLKLNVSRDDSIKTWLELRGKVTSIAQSPPDGMRSLVLDTATVAQALAVDHVVETRQADKGKRVASIEDFGWGRGWQYVAEEFDALLADLDRIRERGIFVCLVCHAISSPFPNPEGENFIRWEPHLYAGDKSKRGSIRDRVYRWADHILFIGYDLYVKEGKALGGETRTIWSKPMATHVAGSRTLQTDMTFELNDPGAIWRALGILPGAS